MQGTKVLEKLGRDIILNILKFFTYSQIMDLYFVGRQFAQFQNDHELFHILLQDQFGVPIHKKGDFKQYYLYLKKMLKMINQAKSISPANKYNESKIEYEMCNQIRKLQRQFQKNQADLRFLMVRSMSEAIENRFVFGGIVYYNQRQFYISLKEEEVDTKGIPLYPQVMLEYFVILADLDNKVGLGQDKRYLLLEVQDNSWTVLRWDENYLQKGTNREGIYFDYFDTLINPKSDQTTRGIRIRTDSRLVPTDDRFDVQIPFFSYQIRFSDNGSTPKGAKLKSRIWIIKSYNANSQQIRTDIVEGEGVIGYFPHIHQGCEDFVYQSCCGIEGAYGSLEGHFVFEDVATKEIFEVKVNPFPLNYGPHVAYKIDKQTMKVKQIV